MKPQLENDEEGAEGEQCGQWIVIDEDTGKTLAVIPKTGDEHFDQLHTLEAATAIYKAFLELSKLHRSPQP